MSRLVNVALLLAGLVMMGGTVPHTAAQTAFYLSPQGHDSNAGTAAQPFATLERARDAIRELKKAGTAPAGPITVWIGGGTYVRISPLQLTTADAGTVQSPIIYRTAVNQTVRIVTGHPIGPAEFKPVTNSALLARLAPAARDKVVQLDLAAQHIAHVGPFPTVFDNGGGLFELFYNGARMTLARWPNEGYTTLAKVSDKGSLAPNRPCSFIYREEVPAHWVCDGNIWLNGFWHVPWSCYAVRVAAIDTTKKQITLAATPQGGLGSKYGGPTGTGKENYYAMNVLEEIDLPGEWCVDFKSKTLYFWPPQPLAQMPNAEIMISDLDAPILELKDVSYVTFRGLTLECGLANGIEISGGTDDLIAGCTIRNLAGYGVVIRGGQHHGVQSCDLYALGRGGIAMSGGDHKTLTPANHFAVNNDIHHVGVLKKTYAPPIVVGAYDSGPSVGCLIAHNRLHDVPHAAVLYGGNEHVLEYNEVYHVALESGDVGAFYTWNDWTSRGNIVRYNFVYDSPRANAFYMDDGDSGDTIFANVVYKTIYGPFIGGGHDNIVRNNLIIQCEKGIHMDARGAARGYDRSNKKMVQAVESVHPERPPWSTRYPELIHLLDLHPELPTGNIIEHNVMVDCKIGLNLQGKKEQLQFSTVRENLALPAREAGLVDPAQLNFALRPDAPIYARLPAFQPIPFAKIGLYLDEYRTRLPARGDQPAATTGPAFDSQTDVNQSNRVAH